MTPGQPQAIRARWERPALGVLLLGTLLLYLCNLGESGWANPYYSAAAQAGSQSWKAFLFGSFDLANGIMVDKPPASLWLMDISVRIFGLSAWSVLVPQALLGVAAVALIYFAVRRWHGAPAALIAGVVLALTPVAALMFRFNNPDALLTVLLTAAAYATIRALEKASLKWICLVGVLIGFAFLTKMLQSLLVVPGFALVYVVAADTTLKRRLLHLCAAAGAMVVAAGWWIVIATVVPAGSRPYVGGSQADSVLELIVGYNGLGRITGDESGSVHLTLTRRWGDVGLLRLWGPSLGGQIGWLLSAALIALFGGLWMTRRRPRTDRERASYVLWGSWLIITGLLFSFMQGIFHQYYTVALAPPIAALVGIGAVTAYRHRKSSAVRVVAAAAVVATGITAFVFLVGSAYFVPPLRWIVLVGAVAAAAGIVRIAALPLHLRRAVLVVTAVVVLTGPTAFVVNTVESAYVGSIVTAGPLPSVARPGAKIRTKDVPIKGQKPSGPGGLLHASKPTKALLSYLRTGSGHPRWLAATIGAQRAAGYQLSLDRPVMAIGGFNGSDPAPTLQQLKDYVAHGDIRWYVDGPPLGGDPGAQVGGSHAAADIVAWVRQSFPAQEIDGVDVYDLSMPE